MVSSMDFKMVVTMEFFFHTNYISIVSPTCHEYSSCGIQVLHLFWNSVHFRGSEAYTTVFCALGYLNQGLLCCNGRFGLLVGHKMHVCRCAEVFLKALPP